MDPGVEIEATVGLTEGVLRVCLDDRRSASHRLFTEVPVEDHVALATEAWRIGLLALRNAHLKAEESRLKDVGKTLMEDVRTRLSEHLVRQEETVRVALQAYFDPRDGQVTRRLEGFVKEDGDLARVLGKFVAEDNSVIAETLARKVGESSPLFKLLSPTDADGVVQQMAKRFHETLDANRTVLRDALDPNIEGSPIQRFLNALRENLKKAGSDQETMVKELTKALDANDESSLLNRLRKDVQESNQRLERAVNPEIDGTPMSTVKNTLTKMIHQHMLSNQELLEKADDRQRRFEKEVMEALGKIQKQKEGALRTTQGGMQFEDLVSRFIESAVGDGGLYLHERTGATVGIIPNCKKGDHVVRFTDAHAYAGSTITVEAKQDQSYHVARVLEELDEAKRNRGSDVGVFVMAASHAPAGFPRFARYANDLLVQWDPEDERTDAYLHAAVVAGMCLATRKRKVVDAGKVDQLATLEAKLGKEIGRYDKMLTHTDRIKRSADGIEEEVRKGRGAIERLVRDARGVLEALDVEARDLDEERGSPIATDGEALARAQDAVRGVDAADDETATWSMPARAVIDAPPVAAYRARKADEEGKD